MAGQQLLRVWPAPSPGMSTAGHPAFPSPGKVPATHSFFPQVQNIYFKKTSTQTSILRGPQESKKLALEGGGQGPGSEGTGRLLGFHPAKSTLYPLTTRGGAYSALIIWSWAECPASAPEVASWGRKGDGRSIWKCPTSVSMVLVAL